VVVEKAWRCKLAIVGTLFEAKHNNSRSFGVCPYVGEQTIHETKQKVSETGFASILREKGGETPTERDRSLAPWSSVLCQQQQVPQLVKKLPAFYGNRKFITTLTTVHLLSLS
jgi:hypothetical protein